MPGSVPPRKRNLVAVDEAELKVNGRIVYAWAAIDADTRGLLAMEATWGALLFLRKVLGRCTNNLYSWSTGARGTIGRSGRWG